MFNIIFLLLNCSTQHVRVQITHDHTPIHLSVYNDQQRLPYIKAMPDYLVQCPKFILYRSDSEEEALLKLVKIKDSKTLVICMIHALVCSIEHDNAEGITVLNEYITSKYNKFCSCEPDFIRLLGQKETYLKAFNPQACKKPSDLFVANTSDPWSNITKLGKQYLQKRVEAKNIRATQGAIIKELNNLPYPLYATAMGGDFIHFFKSYTHIPETIAQTVPQNGWLSDMYQFVQNILPNGHLLLASESSPKSTVNKEENGSFETSISSIKLEEEYPLLSPHVGLRRRKNTNNKIGDAGAEGLKGVKTRNPPKLQ